MSPPHRSVLPYFFRTFVAALALIVAGTSVCAQTPASTTSSLREARRLLSEHQAARAEAIARPLLAHDPQNSTVLAVLAQARLDQGDSNDAMTLLLRALAASPNSREVNNALGDLLLKRHHDPEAMDRFETVLAQTLADPDARRGELAAATELALTARNAQHPEIALEVLRHARAKLPDDPRLLLALGIQADELQLLPEAAEALHSARKISPHDLDIIYALGRLEIDQQHMAAAEADFRTYLAARPGDATAHFGLGHILAMDQRTDEARAEFERSIQLQPVQTESYYQLGQIELDAQHDAQAEPLFRKTLQRDPTHGGALTGMGILSFRAKDYAKAEQYLAAAEKTAPDYGPAHYYRGLSLARLGRKEEADAELRKATELGTAHLGTPQPQ